jgi:uncharacterized protein YktA (UPF0223 family)
MNTNTNEEMVRMVRFYNTLEMFMEYCKNTNQEKVDDYKEV